MTDFETVRRDELQAVADKMARALLDEKNAKATVVALCGDLGSGKTTFVQAAARAFGITETVMSPTFVIERVYKLIHPHFEHFIHIDAYRLKNADELAALGWGELAENPKNIIFVEWAERVQEILPDGATKICFEGADGSTRRVKITHQNKEA